VGIIPVGLPFIADVQPQEEGLEAELDGLEILDSVFPCLG
jgi:hypothetical protein